MTLTAQVPRVNIFDVDDVLPPYPCFVCNTPARRVIEFGAVNATGNVICTRLLCSELCCIRWQQHIEVLSDEAIYDAADTYDAVFADVWDGRV